MSSARTAFIIAFVLVGLGIYVLVRKLLMKSTRVSSDQNASRNSSTHKGIAACYFAGGVLALLMVLPRLNSGSHDVLSALLWLVLLAQIAAALYGGWQCWNSKPIGIQVLYWLSWSCAPVIVSSQLTYWCVIGLGILPTVSLGAGHFGTDIAFRIGYQSQFWIGEPQAGVVIGANIVALVFVAALRRSLQRSGIQPWPLLLKDAPNAG